jgi:ethanolamine utilization protein EutN
MRIGKVVGSLTLSRFHPSLAGGRWKLTVPLSLADLTSGREPTAEPLVVYDDLGAGDGSLIAFSEGAEAAQPFRPEIKPIDAYNAALLDSVDITRS